MPHATLPAVQDSVQNTRNIDRLRVANKLVSAKKSTRLLNKNMLSYLAHEQQERLRVPQRNPTAPTIEVAATAVSCGSNTFSQEDEQLVFASQTSHRTQMNIRLTERLMSIVARNKFRMDIRSETIVDFITDSASWTFVLSEPPRFFGFIYQGSDN